MLCWNGGGEGWLTADVGQRESGERRNKPSLFSDTLARLDLLFLPFQR